ncbi:MAG TPA: medium chain dehydrogenase/reductase family protein, partial [Kofleriaceae bacterium]
GGVVVAIEASFLLSYQKAYVSGALPHYRPPRGAFTIGSSGVGRIAAVGGGVYHLAIGQRVLISPHVVANERTDDRAQILLGLTALNERNDVLQADWRDGTLADYARVPASVVTPLDGLDAIDSATLTVLGRFAVPFGGFARGRLAAGERVIVTGATGAFGTAAVLLALAMSASRVVAAGRDRIALDRLAKLPRVSAVALTGDIARDTAALREAAGGGAQLALDLVGRASDPNATLAGMRALVRGGRLVVMGSMSSPLPLDYNELMINDWEIAGQFMYPADAFRRVVELVRAGLLDLGALRVTTFPIAELVDAMDAAEAADNFTAVAVVR